MSEINSASEVVTKEMLEDTMSDFYAGIFPYLGSYDKGKLTFCGEIKMFYRETAPDGFLICDGTAYDKADYPELANILLSLTDNTPYVVSGDDTKFKVPDLRGEFLRGSGTNSHTNQGSGANVGVHQDGTLISTVNTDGHRVYSSMPGVNANTNNADSLVGNDAWGASPANGTSGTGPNYNLFTSRPTNTSLLFCIAYKDTMVDIDFFNAGGARFSKSDMYDTNEKVIGKWIDGKPLYQKVIKWTGSIANNGYATIATISNVDTPVAVKGFIQESGSINFHQLGSHWNSVNFQNTGAINVSAFVAYGASTVVCAIAVYTKTTDSTDSFKYSSPTDYSTEEKIVGTWIDGKPIYQKVIGMDKSTNLTFPIDVSSLNIDVLIFSDAIGADSKPYNSYPKWTMSGCSGGAGKIIYLNNNSTSLQREGSFLMFAVILQYTKTTD